MMTRHPTPTSHVVNHHLTFARSALAVATSAGVGIQSVRIDRNSVEFQCCTRDDTDRLAALLHLNPADPTTMLRVYTRRASRGDLSLVAYGGEA